MNTQEQMLEYAKNKINANSTYTLEQWCGKMITEGVRCNDGTIARASRSGKTIVITETTQVEKLHGVEETTIEVMRISL